ncbi:MAG TPA: UDP-N-acetylglucosamine 1-carboxyvinyltransferase, partial [Candidatus Fournierella merdigallinarum]|nr:UDP-N-acetylglucosamine 1-carboxyvinyltransferase [Candidatus Fournierella merdigallinarum]
MGEHWVIRGKQPLSGTVRLPAAKNSVLPLLAASLLCGGESYFSGTPRLTDVEASIAILTALGCRCQWRGRGLQVGAGRVRGDGTLPDGPARAMRSSVFYLAPALARFGRVSMPMPGGCRLGPRPIDIHLDGLVKMGARVHWQGETLTVTAPQGLRGVDYTLRLPSVGATETLLMAAVAAKGETVLRGVAREPEIADLARYLAGCGAKIQGAGSSVVRVQGGAALHGAAHQPIPDRIVAATLAAAVASAGGRVRLLGCQWEALAPTLEVLTRAGCAVARAGDAVTVERDGPLKGVGRVYTGVYPAFSTDAAPVVAAALLTAAGRSAVEDTIFEDRFACADGFCALGARAVRCGRALELE